MANILFKRGTQAQFKNITSFADGALYFVEDAGQLYLGTGTGKDDKVRIQGTVVQYADFTAFGESVQPPYDSDVIYYIAASNALVRYDGSKWIQLNVTMDAFNAKVDNLQTQINNNNTSLGNRIAELEKIAGLGGAEEGDQTLPEQIAALTGRVEDIEEDYATGTALNNLKGSDNVGEGVSITVTNAIKLAQAAQTAANNAQTTADRAEGKADTAQGEVDALEIRVKAIEDAPYATTGDVTAAKNALIGTGDVAQGTNEITIKEAIRLAQAAQATANSANADKLNKSEFESFKTTNTKAINDAAALGQTGIDNAATAQLKADTAFNNAATAQQAAEAAQQTANTGVANAATAQGKANDAYALAETKLNTSTFTDFQTTNSKAIEDAAKLGQQGIDNAATAKNAADAAQATANAALPKAGGVMDANNIGIDMNSGKITNLAAPVNNNDAANKKYVDDAIASGIAANDAMTFVGVLGTAAGQIASLPSTANVGDTYKVGTLGTYNGIVAKVGDLIINAAEKDSDAPVWVHVSSGYEDDYDQKFAVANNALNLMDGTGTISRGSFSFANNVSITGDGQDVVAALVWDTF